MTLRETQRNNVEFDPITIERIDRAVRDWFDKTVDARCITTASDSHKIPVIFSTGERYALRRKGIRDKNGLLILPLISIRRTAFDNDPSMQALGVQVPELTISRRIAPKTNNIQNNIQRLSSAGIPIYGPGPGAVYEFASVPFPTRHVITYELVIQASFTRQMNSVLEKLFFEMDQRNSFIAPFENDGRKTSRGDVEGTTPKIKGGYIVGFFDSSVADGSNTDEFTDQERIIRYSTQLRVPAGLIPEVDGEKPTVKFSKSAYAIGFKENIISSEQFYKLFPEEK